MKTSGLNWKKLIHSSEIIAVMKCDKNLRLIYRLLCKKCWRVDICYSWLPSPIHEQRGMQLVWYAPAVQLWWMELSYCFCLRAKNSSLYYLMSNVNLDMSYITTTNACINSIPVSLNNTGLLLIRQCTLVTSSTISQVCHVDFVTSS